ncbi:MAG: endolytic transglycosylase MltG [Parvibaculaceae bacterium]
MTQDTDKPEEAPKPKKRRFLRALLVLSLILPMLSVALAGGAYLVGKTLFIAEGPLQQPKVVWLEKGIGLNAITAKLSDAGVISQPLVFRLGARLSGASASLKAGEYEFPAHISMAGIVRMLKDGKSILHKITIPEGLTSQQIMVIVKADPVLVGDNPMLPSEGALLPETYNFTRGTTRTEIIKRMQRAQTDLMASLWPKRGADLPVKTPEEALILASIVEKETGLKTERPQVAAVFTNRLKIPMRLQSDPTILYGITMGSGPLGRPIRRSEIDKLTPYNTYQIDGLPPTPICNPGRASIEAVLNPPATKDLYFVADGTGGHAFSPSLSGHERNVKEWRKLEQAKDKASK